MNIINRYLRRLKHLRISRHFAAADDLRLREMLNSGFARDASLAAANGSGLRPDQELRLWNSIDRALPIAKRNSLSQRRMQIPLLAGLAAAGICVILFSRLSHTNSFNHESGVKGDFLVVPTLKTLRFAILKPDGQTVSGENNMTIEQGHSLIFFVETEGVVPGQTFPVTLSYQRNGEENLVKIIDTSLSESRQVLSGNKGYIAFTPELTGNYRLVLTPETSKRKETTEEQNAAEISIQVVHPD